MSNILRFGPVWDDKLETLLGNGDEPMEAVEARARSLYPDCLPIVWECDATSFNFSYVSPCAEQLLGFPRDHWLEPMFWAQQVVDAADREDAVNYCLLATKKLRDHMFEYRARSIGGDLIWLRDYVKVVRDAAGKPDRLRGAMFDVTAEKTSAGSMTIAVQQPTRDELLALNA
jgi:PAS domain S-box-containing protein